MTNAAIDKAADLRAAAARLREMRKALRSIVDSYDMRSEIYTNDADMAGNFADKARAALGEE